MRTDLSNKAVSMHAYPIGDWCEECAVRPPNPGRAAALADPAVRRAAADLDRAQAKFDAAQAKWIDALGAARAAELKTLGRPQLVTFDGQPVGWGTDAEMRAQAAEIRRLDEEAAELRAERDQVGQQLADALEQPRVPIARAWRAGGG